MCWIDSERTMLVEKKGSVKGTKTRSPIPLGFFGFFSFASRMAASTLVG
jgi:hypothetical protein